MSRGLWQHVKGTKLFKLKFGSEVQIVLQDTSIVTVEDHPMHLHGYQFYVVGSGFGNFDPRNDPAKFNLVDPPERNTIGTPPGGWVAIRFVADNPGNMPNLHTSTFLQLKINSFHILMLVIY